MRFLNFFSAQYVCLVFGLVMGTDIFYFNLICAHGRCSKRVPINRFSLILSIHFQITISRAWNGLFQKFQSLEIIVWSALALEKGPRTQKYSNSCPKLVTVTNWSLFSKDHTSGLKWSFSKIPKPKANSLICSFL